MTTITLNDDLMNQVVQIGHYQNSQEAVIAILSDYIQTHLTKETLFNNSDFSDENKPTPTITKGDKSLNPTDLFGVWQLVRRNSAAYCAVCETHHSADYAIANPPYPLTRKSGRVGNAHPTQYN